jgi:hypothetical protein
MKQAKKRSTEMIKKSFGSYPFFGFESLPSNNNNLGPVKYIRYIKEIECADSIRGH